ncbi:MAG: anti-sigma F factor [Clostridia bacterium]|nr:anti-sigma F factor [Clostridia bacterium]
MQTINQMKLEFSSVPENEGFARVAVSAFAVQLNPTLDVLADIKTAVSEAVTNAIVHGYAERPGTVTVSARLRSDGILEIEVIDQGRGIVDIAQAMQPFFTTQPEKERSGMGFSVMQTFMDEVQVESSPGQGTTVRMKKRIETAE